MLHGKQAQEKERKSGGAGGREGSFWPGWIADTGTRVGCELVVDCTAGRRLETHTASMLERGGGAPAGAGARGRSRSLPRPSSASTGGELTSEPPWRRSDRQKVMRGIQALFRQRWSAEATPLRHLWASEPAAWPPNLQVGEMLNCAFYLPKPPCPDTQGEYWSYCPLNHAPPNIFEVGHRTPNWSSGWRLKYYGTDMRTALRAVICGELLLESEAAQRPVTTDFDVAVRCSAVYTLHGSGQERFVLLVAAVDGMPRHVYAMGLCVGRLTHTVASESELSEDEHWGDWRGVPGWQADAEGQWEPVAAVGAVPGQSQEVAVGMNGGDAIPAEPGEPPPGSPEKVRMGIAALSKQRWSAEATPLRDLWESEPAAWPPNLRVGEMLNRTFYLPKPPCADAQQEFWRYCPLNHAPPNVFKVGHSRTPNWTSGWTMKYHGTDMPTALHVVSCGELLLEDEAVQRPVTADFDLAVASSAVYPMYEVWQECIVLLVACDRESPQKVYALGLCIGCMTTEQGVVAYDRARRQLQCGEPQCGEPLCEPPAGQLGQWVRSLRHCRH